MSPLDQSFAFGSVVLAPFADLAAASPKPTFALRLEATPFWDFVQLSSEASLEPHSRQSQSSPCGRGGPCIRQLEEIDAWRDPFKGLDAPELPIPGQAKPA